MANRAPVVNPGPDDPHVLYLQTRHVSQAIWQGRVRHQSEYYVMFLNLKSSYFVLLIVVVSNHRTTEFYESAAWLKPITSSTLHQR